MPVWLTEDEYRTLSVACNRMIPPSDTAPGAADCGVPDYIDRLLGAFSFDPPRIWAGGPASGRQGGERGFERFHPLSALDELAWRMRIEGSCGLPEREFNGPVVGLQQRYREGLAALGSDSPATSTTTTRSPDSGRRPSSPSSCTATRARGCTGHLSTGAIAMVLVGGPSTSPGTSSRGAGPTLQVSNP